MQNLKTVAVVNSCFNPAKGWEQTYVEGAKAYIQALPEHDISFVLVNDGSNVNIDRSIEFIRSNVKSFNFVTYKENKGKGFALRKGIKSVEADIYCYTDVDFPYRASSFKSMVFTMVNERADAIIGKRNKKYFDVIPIQRKLISKTLMWFNRHILGLQHYDTQCGIKLISRRLKPIFCNLNSNGFLFEIEFMRSIEKTYPIVDHTVELQEGVELRNIKFTRLLKLVSEYLINFIRKS